MFEKVSLKIKLTQYLKIKCFLEDGNGKVRDALVILMELRHFENSQNFKTFIDFIYYYSIYFPFKF